MEGVWPLLLFLILGSLFVAIFIISYQLEQKRRKALALAAAALGLRFDAERNDALAEELEFLNQLQTGNNRYAECVITGEFAGYPVRCFDYHYETSSSTGKGRRRTEHHWHHLCTLRLPKSFPELTIGPENLFTRAAKVFGYGSIDFESAEFSRAFLVRSNDKKFAYDVCHPQMMEYLLKNQELTVEIEHTVLALIFPDKAEAEELADNLRRMVTFRDKLPAYLFDV